MNTKLPTMSPTQRRANSTRFNIIEAVKFCTAANVCPLAIIANHPHITVECDSTDDAFELQQTVSKDQGSAGAVVIDGTERSVRITFDL